MRFMLTLAALLGAIAVAFGAFAAHGASEHAASLLETGSRYQLIHALAAFAASACATKAPRAALTAACFFIAGAIIFPGALYALAFEAPRVFGAVAPIGGLAFIAGWLALAFAASR